jgi:hypothetical protein
LSIIMAEKQIPSLIDRETWQAVIAQRQGIGEVALSNLVEPLSIHNVGDAEHAYNALTHLLWYREDDDTLAEELEKHVNHLRTEALKDQPNPFMETSEHVEPIGLQTKVLSDPKVKEFVARRDISDSHQKMVEVWPHFVDTFVAGVENGVKLGYIPGHIEKRLGDALEKTSTRVVDTAILAAYGIYDSSAFYLNTRDEVGLNHEIADQDNEYHNNLVHEYTHKVSGGTFKPHVETKPGEQPISDRPRVGYATEVRHNELKRTGLNEAVTQHLTMGILTGDFETIDPDQRSDGDRTYYSYRKVLADFVEKAQGLIDVKTVTNGFYEDTGPEGSGSIEARKRFIGEAVKAYGHGALNKLDKLCIFTDMSSSRLNELVLNRINPPILDKHGNVVSIGNIDNLPTFEELYRVRIRE